MWFLVKALNLAPSNVTFLMSSTTLCCSSSILAGSQQTDSVFDLGAEACHPMAIILQALTHSLA
eukprot:scaffold348617_cov55-Prasinocladus_malaysianus.AAC.1